MILVTTYYVNTQSSSLNKPVYVDKTDMEFVFRIHDYLSIGMICVWMIILVLVWFAYKWLFKYSYDLRINDCLNIVMICV